MELGSPALQADSLPSEPLGKPPGNIVFKHIIFFWKLSYIFQTEDTERPNNSFMQLIIETYSFDFKPEALSLMHTL